MFQPAEEVQPGGALDVIAAGGLDGVGQIFAFHCDPKVDVGQVGTRIGPITSASDEVTVTVSGPGGHTSRPHLTGTSSSRSVRSSRRCPRSSAAAWTRARA